MAGAGNDVVLSSSRDFTILHLTFVTSEWFYLSPVRVSSGFPIEAFGNDGFLEGLEIAFIT